MWPGPDTSDAACCESCAQGGACESSADALAAGSDDLADDPGSLVPAGWVVPEYVVPGVGSAAPRLVVVVASGTYAANATDGFIKADASGASFTITLPPAASAGAGKLLTVKKIDSSTNLVTIDGSGSETIDDLADLVLRRQYEAVTLISDGSEWWIQSHST